MVQVGNYSYSFAFGHFLPYLVVYERESGRAGCAYACVFERAAHFAEVFVAYVELEVLDLQVGLGHALFVVEALAHLFEFKQSGAVGQFHLPHFVACA